MKKDFYKIQERKKKEQEAAAENGEVVEPVSVYDKIEGEEDVVEEEPTLDRHPDRQAFIDSAPIPQEEPKGAVAPFQRRLRNPRMDPYKEEVAQAQQQREEAERREQERQESYLQWQARVKEREKMQKAMRKARVPGKDGKRRLGRESNVLLEKVKKLVEKG